MIEKKEIAVEDWWHNGNTLALADAIMDFCTEKDGGFSGELHATFNSSLIGAARLLGMSEDSIREAFASDRCLTIYEP